MERRLSWRKAKSFKDPLYFSNEDSSKASLEGNQRFCLETGRQNQQNTSPGRQSPSAGLFSRNLYLLPRTSSFSPLVSNNRFPADSDAQCLAQMGEANERGSQRPTPFFMTPIAGQRGCSPHCAELETEAERLNACQESQSELGSDGMEWGLRGGWALFLTVAYLPHAQAMETWCPAPLLARFSGPSAHSVASWSLLCLCQSLCPTLAASTTRTSVRTSAEHSR